MTPDPVVTLLICASLTVALWLVYLGEFDEAVRKFRRWWNGDFDEWRLTSLKPSARARNFCWKPR